jgi:hypothetical protein
VGSGPLARVGPIYQFRDVFGHEVHMFHADNGVSDIEHFAGFVHPIPCGNHDMFGFDVAIVRMDDPCVVRLLRQTRHRAVSRNLCPRFARAARQRLTQLRGVNVTVQIIPQGTQQPVILKQRITLHGLGGIKQIEINPKAFGHRDNVVGRIHIDLIGDQAHPARTVVIVDRIVRIVREFFVKLDRVFAQKQQQLVERQLRALRGRVPCRAGRKLVALQKHNICPTLLGQVIKRRKAANAAANNDNPC